MPDTMLRLVHRERVLLAGGQRALVLQLAHPMVAAGVADHSDFPQQALKRLRSTLDRSLTTVFGTPQEVDQATATLRRLHERVSGTRGDRAYHATDPELLLWVHATLVDTTMHSYSRFVRPLSEDAWRRYYAESMAWALGFGIPAAILPADLEAFRDYVRDMLRGAELRPTEESRRLVRAVLHPPVPIHVRPAVAAARLLTLAMLPESIRERFGLRGGPASRFALAASSATSRALLPLVPQRVRTFEIARGR